MKFPSNFYWGSAASAYQVEGGITNNDWAYFARQGKVPDAGLACDHYNRYEEDFDIAKDLGQNAHRLSIEWSRVEPEEGKFSEKEIEHYRKVILALKERNLEPFVTLHHFTNPIWFAKKGGWENERSWDYFSRYAQKIVNEFNDLIRFWITINEPVIFSSHAYLFGRWPPLKKNISSAVTVFLNLIKAHKKAYQVIKECGGSKKLAGIAESIVYYEPYKNRLAEKILSFFADYFRNKYFLNRIKDYQDFIGLNYYHHNRVKIGLNNPKYWLKQNENKEVSDLGWEIYPGGIYQILKELSQYKKPIYVTENGLADARDEKRPKFIVEHLKWVSRAISEGADVRGYFHWSLLDNFEWDKGFGPRFGLIEVDYKTLERRIRPSALVYAKICRENAIQLNF